MNNPILKRYQLIQKLFLEDMKIWDATVVMVKTISVWYENISCCWGLILEIVNPNIQTKQVMHNL